MKTRQKRSAWIERGTERGKGADRARRWKPPPRYTLRKVKEEFRKHRNDVGEEVERALKKGKEQLEVAKRQVAVYQLYAPAQLSIMDLKVN